MIEHILTDKTEVELQTVFAADPTQLSFIAEDFGKVSKDYALLICCVAICHEKSYVREGALYGLARYIKDPDIRAMVEHVAEHDNSAAIREIAAECLEDWAIYGG